MGWKSEFNNVENIMELTLEGVMDFKTLTEAIFIIVESAKNHNTVKYLADCRLVIPEFGRGQIFELINKFFPEWDIPIGSIVSIIEPKDIDAKTKAEFYVYAVKKLGWDADIFPNRKRALEWLNKH